MLFSGFDVNKDFICNSSVDVMADHFLNNYLLLMLMMMMFVTKTPKCNKNEHMPHIYFLG